VRLEVGEADERRVVVPGVEVTLGVRDLLLVVVVEVSRRLVAPAGDLGKLEVVAGSILMGSVEPPKRPDPKPVSRRG